MKMGMEIEHTQPHFRIYFSNIFVYFSLVLVVLYLLQCFLLQEDDSLNALLYHKADIACEVLLILPASVAKALSADPPLPLPGRV